jgi:arylsulfatase A-like enzyme
VSQVDLLASFASFTGQKLAEAEAPDSFDVMSTLLGKSSAGREHLVQQATVLSLRERTWKYIEPSKGPRVAANTEIETGNDPGGQLYDLSRDLGEQRNLAAEFPERMRDMAARLAQVREMSRSRR